MGCNCKNKAPQKKSIDDYKKEVIQEIEITQPPFTWEEVIRVKDYISSRNKTEEERHNALSFNEKYFGEPNTGYCDQICMERLSKRLDIATALLQQYEQKK